MAKFKIPFTFSDVEILKRKSKVFIKFTKPKRSRLDDYLLNSGERLGRRQYLSICYRSFLFNILTFSVIFTSVLGIMRADQFYFYGLGSALMVSGLVFMNQLNYPRIFSLNKERDIERNLISVLQDMLVQLNSGVPMFRIIVNISESSYGQVSEEFKKIAKEINSGTSQIEAIDKHAKVNTSAYFRRILWQISNGMRSGSDMSFVIEDAIRNLSDEQEVQIQSYGSKLNPLIMFYMLMAVILPSLGITFLIIVSSLLNLSGTLAKLIFFLIFGFVVFMQIMFLGLIKSRRPSLL
jgi:flagellar protein FlaJ